MAEAAVEDRPVTKYFCHKCTVEFDIATTDYTCPHCLGGFIEELEAVSGHDNNEDESSDVDVDLGFRGFPAGHHILGDLSDLSDLWSLVTTVGDYQQNPRTANENAGNNDEQPRRGRSRAFRVGGGSMRPSFDNVIADLVLNLTTGQRGWTFGQGVNPLFIVGNPADYAWGREGLDAIVTQLLNQIDGTGPPPMPKDKITALPEVNITDDQVRSKLQCSVCWEDFSVGESVRSLPCQHVYHSSCICPWLELHATCPICRKSLTEEAAEAAANTTNNVSNELAALFRAAQSEESENDVPEPSTSGAWPETTATTTTRTRETTTVPRRRPSGDVIYDIDVDMELDMVFD